MSKNINKQSKQFKRRILLGLLAVVGIVVNLTANFILIPRLHAQGAAIVSLTTQMVMAGIQTVIAFRQLKLPITLIPWLKVLIFSIVIIPSTILFAHYFQGNALVALLISGAFATIVAFATGLLQLRFWKNLERK